MVSHEAFRCIHCGSTHAIAVRPSRYYVAQRNGSAAAQHLGTGACTFYNPGMSLEPTLLSLLVDRWETSAGKVALRVKRQGDFVDVTWNELQKDVLLLAAGLVRRGVQAGDRVAQVSDNRYEWIVADLAIQCAGAVHVPIHAPLTGPQIAYQVSHSESRLVLLSGESQEQKIATRMRGEVPCFGYDDGSRAVAELTADVTRQDVEDVRARRMTQVTQDSLATILSTSRTTGEPKGVMLSQRNLTTNTLGTIESFGQQETDVRLGFLPFSHIFARTCDVYTWIARGSILAIAESRETVLADCAATRPTLLNGVPYFYDKVYRYLCDQGLAEEPGSLRKLLGGNIRLCCSGGAALPDRVFDFFHEHEVPLLQGYGLSETSPVVTLSSADHFKRGCSGKPLPDVEVRIADDGEVLTRGPHVMQGYWKDQAATDALIRDGWLHTGDLGELDDEGFLRITGRKKEILVLSSGKNVAPVYLESLLTQDPLIIQALVVGDNRKHLAALIVPDPDALRAEIKRQKLLVFSRAGALAHPKVVQMYEQRIAARLADVAPHEQVRRFRILDRGFTIDSGELTPKMTLRRAVIEKNLADVLAAMYD